MARDTEGKINDDRMLHWYLQKLTRREIGQQLAREIGRKMPFCEDAVGMSIRRLREAGRLPPLATKKPGTKTGLRLV